MRSLKYWYRSKWYLAGIVLCLATVYPTDLPEHDVQSRAGHQSHLVMGTEIYGRHLNTVVPLVAIVILRDLSGLKQVSAIAVTAMVASHGPKRLLNDVEIMGTRLGQRPRSAQSKHNMPSGHSTLASAGAYFTARRYSWWFGLLVWPVLFLTMYARVMLDAHTVSATIAGALTGILVAALFTRPSFRYRRFLASLPKRKPRMVAALPT